LLDTDLSISHRKIYRSVHDSLLSGNGSSFREKVGTSSFSLGESRDRRDPRKRIRSRGGGFPASFEARTWRFFLSSGDFGTKIARQNNGQRKAYTGMPHAKIDIQLVDRVLTFGTELTETRT